MYLPRISQALFISEAVMRVHAEFRYEGIPFDEAAFRDNAEVTHPHAPHQP